MFATEKLAGAGQLSGIERKTNGSSDRAIASRYLVLALLSLHVPFVAQAAETPEDCAKLDPQYHEDCLSQYVDSLEQASIDGCAIGRSTPERLRGEDPIAAERKYALQCKADLTQELRDRRPTQMEAARERLAVASKNRRENLERGARLGQCIDAAATHLAASSATLTEIGEVALVRCADILNEILSLDAFKDDREARLDLEASIKRRAMDTALKTRSQP